MLVGTATMYTLAATAVVERLYTDSVLDPVESVLPDLDTTEQAADETVVPDRAAIPPPGV